ncbi:MAG TPA: PilC/PilY family type IV pilus protein [Nevskiales bacterium]|nr:PilC/PilY family type IV pilus protein [Nevskiales bacterium]
MRKRIRLVSIVLLTAGTLFGSAGLYAAVATVPLFVSTSATPNVMLLFDNSGSMNNIIWATGYNPNTTYPNWANYNCDRGGQSQTPCWTAQEGNVILSDIYDDRGSCNSVSVSSSGTPGTARIRGVKGSTTRCLLLPDPVGAHATRYTGNYLNYLFETYATVTGNGGRDLTTGLIPSSFRLQTAKNVAINFVNSNANLRIGLSSFNPPSGSGSSFNGAPGGRINAVCGTATSSLVSAINGFTASTNTPLAETLYEITRYFRGMTSFYNASTSYTSPIQYRCQRNFAIVVTDGAPTFDRTFPTNDPDDPRESSRSLPNWDGLSPAPPARFSDGDNISGDAEGDTYYLDDIAKFGYEIDMRTGGNDLAAGSFNDPRFPIQSLRTYTVGFTVANQMLEDAAFYGDGRYFTANNDAELNAALRSAISDIQTRTSAAASVATNSTRLSTDTLIFQARFSTNDWSGQLLAYPVSSSGTVGIPAWDAKDHIPAPGSRNIVTLSGGTGVNFLYANLNSAQKNALKLKPDNSSGDDAYGTAVVNYLRGDDSGEAPDAQDFRPRTSRLGDIINSDPVFVGKQDFGFDVLPGTEGSAYRTFRASSAYQNRIPMIYVGANDGMLHGFNATSGQPNSGDELFAYVPNAIIPNLRFLTEASRADDPGNVGLPASGYNQKHRYFVDGSSRVIDAYLTLGSSTAWRTILVGALGAGGRGVFALNVTDPSALGTSTPLWEFTSSSTGGSEMGFSIPQPSMGRMYNGSWAAIVANGYESASNTARLYILDLATGSVIKEFNTGVGSASQPNGLSSPIPVDVDQDRIVDFIYAGDLWGNLWKFDVTSNNVSQWDFGFKQGSTPKPLFTACTDASSTTTCYNTRQSITARPEVGNNPTGGQMVYVGTGKYFEDCDARTTTNGSTVSCTTTGTATQVVQSFYAIRDLFTKGSTGTPAPVGSGRSTTNLLQQQVIATQTFSFTNPDGSPGSDQVRVTSNNSIDNTHKGWYIDLPIGGERQVANPILRGGRIIFTTLIPNNDPCGFGGDSWLMELDALSGSRLSFSPFDLNNDGVFTIGDFVQITIGGNPVMVPVSGSKSTEGIIKTPGILNAGGSGSGGGDDRKQYKLASGTTGGIFRKGEYAGDDSGRQSWRQIR